MFYNELTAFLKANPLLKWQSESSGETIEAVRLPWFKILRWKDEFNGSAEQRLLAFLEPSDSLDSAYVGLHRLFFKKKLVSFKRPTKKAAEFDLYILAFFGWWYVGIKTKLIET